MSFAFYDRIDNLSLPKSKIRVLEKFLFVLRGGDVYFERENGLLSVRQIRVAIVWYQNALRKVVEMGAEINTVKSSI